MSEIKKPEKLPHKMGCNSRKENNEIFCDCWAKQHNDLCDDWENYHKLALAHKELELWSQCKKRWKDSLPSVDKLTTFLSLKQAKGELASLSIFKTHEYAQAIHTLITNRIK